MRSYLTFILTLCLIASLIPSPLVAQTGITLNSEAAMEGYTLFENSTRTFLINNCGEVVNTWYITNTNNHAKLLPNGNLVYIQYNHVKEIDWEGNEVVSITHSDNDVDLAYEVIVLPSGNYLCVARRNFSIEQFLNIGYNYGNISTPEVVDIIVELDHETGDIVWEWNIADHVIQQRMENLANYGILTESPELLNMDAIGSYDWNFYESFMINGMDYNPNLDQIVLSVRKISEIVIIDHSTTTQEAAGHTGGNAGKGGDILYRWGNPQNYGRGTEEDRVLFFQHNSNWITEGEHEGKIICYNNGLTRPVAFNDRYSSIPIIAPPIDSSGQYLLAEGEPFGPANPTLEYSRIATGTQFYSSYTSGAEYLPNGNIYITEGVTGRLLEVDPTGEIVWTYYVSNADYIFRSEKYPADYAAFDDRELVPSGSVAGTTSQYDCMIFTSINEALIAQTDVLKMHYHSTTHQIEMINHSGHGFQYSLYNLQGQTILNNKTDFAHKTINIQHLPSAMYILSLTDNQGQNVSTFKIIKQ